MYLSFVYLKRVRDTKCLPQVSKLQYAIFDKSTLKVLVYLWILLLITYT